MIKLADILKEMAISNAWSGDRAKLAQETEVVIEAAKKMGLDNPIIWRGTKGVKVPGQKKSVFTYIMHVTPRQTTAFRGGTANAIEVLKMIGVKNPVFAHFDRALTEFFGRPCALVLEQPYKLYQSSEHSDIMADTSDWQTVTDYNTNNGVSSTSRTSKFKQKTKQELEDIASTYREIGSKPQYKNREVIIDVTNYWAVPCGDEIKTYGDLVKLLESYKVKFPPPAEKVQEDAQQPLTYEEFMQKIHNEILPYKGKYAPEGEYYNKVIATIKGKTNKKDIIDALKELEKTSKLRALSSLIGKCVNDFKVEQPRWDLSKMATRIKK